MIGPESPLHTMYVYFFGGGKADGNGKMKDVLGGKGAGLAEMTNAGSAGASRIHHPDRSLPRIHARQAEPQIDEEMLAALEKLEKLQGQKLGKGENPLLVSVRSGAKFSMPGMMDTILNLGLNDQAVEALAKRSNNPRFAYDSYRRLIQMFGDVVLDVPKKKFEHIFDGVKASEER
jgi:pyruvate, orthophosphate dikinase